MPELSKHGVGSGGVSGARVGEQMAWTPTFSDTLACLSTSGSSQKCPLQTELTFFFFNLAPEYINQLLFRVWHQFHQDVALHRPACQEEDTYVDSGPQLFWHQGSISWKTIFPQNVRRAMLLE